MAMSVNGMIAKENDDTPWSDEIWKNYYKTAKRFKAIIVGRRTYDLMNSVNEFGKIGNPFVIVLSHQKKDKNQKHTFLQDPNQAIELLNKKKFKEVLLGGGGTVNGLFMKENLIDEIYLDIEPKVFEKGIHLFGDSDFDADLKLLNVKKISKNLIQLHYKVEK